MSEHILVSTEDRVMRIELNRPEKKNAFTPEMYPIVADALEEADASPQVRVILIHGQKDCFSGGADLKDFRVAAGEMEDTFARGFLTKLPKTRKPIVAAVGGVAVGIGTTMLFHCDLVYAADNAKFIVPFIDLAVVPEAGASMLLPRLAGYQRAAEVFLLGKPFGPERALELGLVTRIVPADELLEEAYDTALVLAQKPPAAVMATKALLKREREPVASRIDAETRVFLDLMSSPETQEAVNAFFEKRKPDFSKF